MPRRELSSPAYKGTPDTGRRELASPAYKGTPEVERRELASPAYKGKPVVARRQLESPAYKGTPLPQPTPKAPPSLNRLERKGDLAVHRGARLRRPRPVPRVSPSPYFILFGKQRSTRTNPFTDYLKRRKRGGF